MFASDRKPFMTAYARMGDSPGARHWLAGAAHLVERAERTMLAVTHAADPAGHIASRTAQLNMDLADAARDCRSAVDKLLDLHGVSGFNTANPLQRYWRDIAVGSRHPHLNLYLALERLGLALVPTTETDRVPIIAAQAETFVSHSTTTQRKPARNTTPTSPGKTGQARRDPSWCCTR